MSRRAPNESRPVAAGGAPPPEARDVTLDVDGIAAGGDGVGRADGLVVFTPRTAPGDRVRVRATSAGRFARGVLEEIVVASPRRVEPPCAHYTIDRCGGCQLQHLDYDAQREGKAAIVRDSLQRIGRRTVELPHVVASPNQWRYRRKLTLAMRRAGDAWVMGLHPYDDPTAIFDLRDCPITEDAVVATWREIAAAATLLPDEPSLRGAVRRAERGMAVSIEGGRAWSESARFFERVPSAAALWWTPDDAPRRLQHERAATPAGASFGQVNAGVAESLAEHVRSRVHAHAPRSVVDGYAGTGDTAAALAAEGIRVSAVELDTDAAARCAARLPRGSRVFAARVEDVLSKLLPVDVVVLNPPRAGLHERVTRVLASQRALARAIVYVSCDPATLARDVARLPRYRIAGVRCFDMFPQTAHVETVCELVPEAA